MAGFFHARQAGDLAVGKPPLHKYPKALSVGAALKALQGSDASELSLWEELCPLTEKPIKEAHANARDLVLSPCPLPQSPNKEKLWRCVGKVGMVDLICFLAQDHSLADQAAALRTPVSSLVPDTAFTIQHVDSRSKLIDALAHVLDGAQHLVVSIDRSVSSRLARYNSMPKVRRGVPQLISNNNKAKGGQQPGGKCTLDATLSLPPRSPSAAPALAAHGGVVQEYCWLTPEDLLQFLLSCIGLFSPLPMMTIQQLGIVNRDVLTVPADSPAASALPLLQRASNDMTAVAVLDPDDHNKLLADISPFTLRGSDAQAALALATLSVKDFLAFSRDCDHPPPSLLHLVASKLTSKLKFFPQPPQEPLFSDSDSPVSFPSPLATSPLAFYSLDSSEESASSSDEDILFSSGVVVRRSRAHAYSKGRVAPNMCRPWSSLVAVMAQALTHRVGYIWVTDDDNSLLGIVTYLDIIHCILGQLYSSD